MRFSYILHPRDKFWVVVDQRRQNVIVSVHSSETSAAAQAMELEQDWRRKNLRHDDQSFRAA